MYKVTIYENKLAFRYPLSEELFYWRWFAWICAIMAIVELNKYYQNTGLYLTYEIEKV